MLFDFGRDARIRKRIVDLRSFVGRRGNRRVELVQTVGGRLASGANAPANAEVIWGRAEEQPVDAFGVGLAKALAQPVTAVEWVLPLVAPGGVGIFWLGASADLGAVAAVSSRVGGGEPRVEEGLVVVPKLAPTPAGFPRRVGVAKKRPLA